MGLVAASSCTAPRADGYARRQPELTALHRTLREHWPAFVEQAEQAGGLPRFVMREVQQYLHCGLLEHGCALLMCEGCGKSLLVAPSDDRVCSGHIRNSQVGCPLGHHDFADDTPWHIASERMPRRARFHLRLPLACRLLK